MTEIAEGVIRVETPLEGRRNDVYAFTGPARTLIFDTGVDGVADSHLIPGLNAAGIAATTVSHVVVSHCDVDHFGGLAAAHEHFSQAVFLAHAADAAMMQDFDCYLSGRGRSFLATYGLDEPTDGLAWARQVTREAAISGYVAGGETVDLGDRKVEILHLPGHSRGHLGIHDPRRSLVAISDAVLGSAVPDAAGHPLFPPTYRHVDDYLATIQLLRELKPTRLLTAHYGIFEGAEVQAFLDSSEAFCHALGSAVESAIADAGTPGLTLAQCTDQLLPDVGDWPREGRLNALAFPVCGHIEKLAAKGRIDLDVTSVPALIKAVA